MRKQIMDAQTLSGKVIPQYKCHKVVSALTISRVSDADAHGYRTLTFEESGFDSFDCPASMFARYIPVPGDYLVIYRDDYKSISPAKEFEDGYSPFEG
jgi:hypothetical protein